MSGDRERKRAERNARKQRAAERQAGMAARTEAKNQAAREELEPLAPGERPGAVTAAAIVAAVVALIFTVSAVVAATGAIHVRGREPSPIPLAAFAAVLWAMTWGLWNSRYWAVLGFQMLLLLEMLATAGGLVQVATIPQLLATSMLLIGSGVLFFFMIRAMARIQMPKPPGSL